MKRSTQPSGVLRDGGKWIEFPNKELELQGERLGCKFSTKVIKVLNALVKQRASYTLFHIIL